MRPLDLGLWCPRKKKKNNPRFFFTVVSQDVNCSEPSVIWQEESHVLVTTVDSRTGMDCLGSNISYLSVARVTEEEEAVGARRGGATAGLGGCK